jgi:hypothetical protein
MHREISHADSAFGQQSRHSLYLLTALVGLIIAADLWPLAAAFFDSLGLWLPSWPSAVGGYRIALVAALVGGARVLYGRSVPEGWSRRVRTTWPPNDRTPATMRGSSVATTTVPARRDRQARSWTC